jgi:2-oxoisovalerate dehydrogenase E1 component
MATRPELVDQNFIRAVSASEFPPSRTGERLTPREVGLQDTDLVDLFGTQVMSRQMDFMARILREKGRGYYTIGSSGHEGTAAVARAFRLTDMAFLHYRSAAFFIQRCKMLPGSTPLYDLLLSLAASADDPISGGRHKVLGSQPHFVPPQTSTIASQLPKAVGAAYAIPRARALGLELEVPGDSLAICSFGDASANHSTAVGAFNTAEWIAYQGAALPLVFVCEDNGIGISVRTPPGWIEAVYSRRPVLRYFACDGLDLLDVYRTARLAEQVARREKRPVFLHVKTVRLFGHAGADVETIYRTLEEVKRDEAQDPLLHTARLLVENRILTSKQILDIYESVRERVARIADEVILRPKLKTADEVMASIVPPAHSWKTVPPLPAPALRDQIFAKDREAMRGKQHLARHLNWALADVLLRYPNTVVLGEDVAKKGGVYNVTTGLLEKFSSRRVFDSLLDEQSILGVSMGMAHYGFVPIPEIQFLAYFHNAEDQIRGEAATLSFFSEGRFTNPMVVRIAGLPYQKGFGGHFHNDNSLAVFRDIPGIIVACPSNGEDAAKMLRTCVRLAHEQRRVVIFVEPIALYMTRDLHAPGDLEWTFQYPEPVEEIEIPVSQFAVWGEGKDVCIVSYANGYYLSRQAAKILSEKHGIQARVIDLRWIKPLDTAAIVREAQKCQSVLIVDECRETGSLSEELMTAFLELDKQPRPIRRLCAKDCFIPLGEGSTITLPDRDGIVREVCELLGKVPQKSEVQR